MRIVIITNHCCGRVIKQARALKHLGYELHLVTTLLPADLDIFDSINCYRYKEDLATTLSLFSDRDIFHIHNEPSWMATVVRVKYDNARIVLDMHDSNYWRVEGMKWFEDDVAMQCADALVFTSHSMQALIEKYGKPYIVIPSAVLKEDFRYKASDYWGGLVSEGGHSLPTDQNVMESWRDYTALYTILKDKKQVFA